MRSTPLTPERLAGQAPRVAHAAAALARTVQIGWAAIWAAPAVLAGRCVFYAFLLTVLTSFWDKVAAEGAHGGLARALPAGGLALYIGVTEWMVLATPAIHLKLEDDIRSGALQARLLRPKSHLVMRLGEGLGAMAARLTAIGALALLLLLLSGRPGPPIALYPAILAVGALGAVVGLLNLALVGLTAFWLRRTLPVYLVNQKASFLLGGLVAPITLYPHWLEKIGASSPYAAELYWPAALTIHPSPALFARALETQLAWIVILGLMALGLWAAGLRKILKNGGAG